ncbi:hypothetical protein BG004_000395 [Podila humilis]|nr:hypothetical protein BG004_000395 [Podila humilis]
MAHQPPQQQQRHQHHLLHRTCGTQDGELGWRSTNTIDYNVHMHQPPQRTETLDSRYNQSGTNIIHRHQQQQHQQQQHQQHYGYNPQLEAETEHPDLMEIELDTGVIGKATPAQYREGKRTPRSDRAKRSLSTYFRPSMTHVTRVQPTTRKMTQDFIMSVSPVTGSRLVRAETAHGRGGDAAVSSPGKMAGYDSMGHVVRNPKRSNIDLDHSSNVTVHEADSKRPRGSSPFQDTVAPVRFESPEPDAHSGHRDSHSNLSIEMARKANLRMSRAAEQYEEGLSFSRSMSRNSEGSRQDARLSGPGGRRSINDIQDRLTTKEKTWPKRGLLDELIVQQQDQQRHHQQQSTQEDTQMQATNEPMSPVLNPVRATVSEAPIPPGPRSAATVDVDPPTIRTRVGAQMPPGNRGAVSRSRLNGRPLQTSQADHAPPSRLVKQPSSTVSYSTSIGQQTTTTTTQGLLNATKSNDGSKMMRTASANNLKNALMSGINSGLTKNAGGVPPTGSASVLFRPTINRTNTAMSSGATTTTTSSSSSVTKSDRKVLTPSKSLSALKKQTRPTLPDTTLTSKTFTSLFSGVPNSNVSKAAGGTNASTSANTNATGSGGGGAGGASAVSVVSSSPKKDSKRDGISSFRESITADHGSGTIETSSVATKTTSTQDHRTVARAIMTTRNLKTTVVESSLTKVEDPRKQKRKLAEATSAATAAAVADNGSSSSNSSNRARLQDTHNDNNPFLASAAPQNYPPVLPRRTRSEPQWASWEDLEKALQEQNNLNPEEIFGPLPALDIAEIFPGNETTARSRNSSAHWAADRLTQLEVVKYNQDMGWDK